MNTPTDPVFFSIIVPCYNGEQYIEEALDSALTQSFQDFEIIVVNDGSTDRSQAVLEKLSARHEKLHIFQQANKGLPGARNTAIRKASGRWFLLLDADDIFEPNRLEVLHKTISENPNQRFIFHDSYRISSEGISESSSHIHRKHFFQDLEKFSRLKEGSLHHIDAKLWQFLLCNYTAMLPITIAIESSLMTSLLGPFDESLIVGEDVDFCARCLKQLDSVLYLDAPLTKYRLHENSMTHDIKYPLRKIGYFKTMKEKFYQDLEHNYKQAFDHKFSDLCLSISYAYRKKYSPIKALLFAIRGFLVKPSLKNITTIIKSFLPARA